MADVNDIKQYYSENFVKLRKLEKLRNLKQINLKNKRTRRKARKRSRISRRRVTDLTGCAGIDMSSLQDMNEWQLHHQIAYWKGRALALERENQMLHEHIRRIYNVSYPNSYNKTFCNVESTKSCGKAFHPQDISSDSRCMKYTKEYNNESLEQDKEDDGHEITFEVDEEWLKFMEKSTRHKLELKKQKEAKRQKYKNESRREKGIYRKSATSCSSLNSTSINNEYRSNENCTNKEHYEDIFTSYAILSVSPDQYKLDMMEMYGEGASKILAFETTIQCNYDRYKSMNSPPYWPNIALKI